MRLLVMWCVIFGLVVTPAMAGTDGAGRKDAAKKAGEPSKADASAKLEAGALGIELQQLKELLQAQAAELAAQRAALHEQQQRMAALEAELRLARTGGATAAPAASPATANGVAAVAQAQDELTQRVGKLETDVVNNKKSAEAGLKSIGPFTFSGDFRLRDEPFFGGPSNQSQVRNRERYRLRFNVNAKLNDEINGGLSLASGDLNDPISTNQTTNQFYTRKPIAFDRAFINYNPHYFRSLTLTGGKFAYPFYRTELVWDNDLNPEGLAQTVAWHFETFPLLRRIALVGFELPFTEVAGTGISKSIVQSAVYGGQVQSDWRLSDWLKFTADAAFYNYHNADPIALALAQANTKNPQSPLLGLLPLAGASIQNTIVTTTATTIITTAPGTTFPTGVKTITNAQFASKFGLFDAIARFDVKTPYQRWPIILQGDFVQNTEACANVHNLQPKPGDTATTKFSQVSSLGAAVPITTCDARARRGYWLEARFGRTNFPGQVAEKGDWDFAYTRMFIEREAVMDAFNFSDLRQNSNVSQHRIEVFYQAFKNVQLAFTGLIGRPLVTPFSPTPAENTLKRLQFDVVYKF